MTLYFTKEHEWLLVEGEEATVGITAHAADELGELVFIEVKDSGTVVEQGDAAAVVESVKAASDIYAPVSGEITAANPRLTDEPSLVSENPQAEGWIFKMRISDSSQLGALLDEDAYKALLG